MGNPGCHKLVPWLGMVEISAIKLGWWLGDGDCGIPHSIQSGSIINPIPPGIYGITVKHIHCLAQICGFIPYFQHGFTTLDRFVWESCTPKPNGWSFSHLSMASFLEVYGTPMYTPFSTTPHYQIVHHPIRSHSLPWNAMNIPLKIKDRLNIQIPSYYETMPLFQNIHRLI